MTLVLLNLFIAVSAQNIFSVEYPNQANVKVFVAKYENQADLRVFKVKYKSQAKENDGKWFSTEPYALCILIQFSPASGGQPVCFYNYVLVLLVNIN